MYINVPEPTGVSSFTIQEPLLTPEGGAASLPPLPALSEPCSSAPMCHMDAIDGTDVHTVILRQHSCHLRGRDDLTTPKAPRPSLCCEARLRDTVIVTRTH